ncbi:unnamed protein product [Cuscuta campestris]|uniref:PDZ domain-containing protein n=1 Tax=Cuscuta campestris TaxID=132261 RepID=A0A484MUY6_9ASTE|nr:unnamed protein product [Cuscuta campestris]
MIGGIGTAVRAAARRCPFDSFRPRNPLIAGHAVDRLAAGAAAGRVLTHRERDKLYHNWPRPCSAGAFQYGTAAFLYSACSSTSRSEENGQGENGGEGAIDGVKRTNLESSLRKSNFSEAYSAIELALDSVVKIFTLSSSPNYFLPWVNKVDRESTGSGFVIPGKRILTNAHVVADHIFVLVRKHGSSTKYKAEVQAVGHECDLAILVVEDEKFWEDTNPLELGDIPFLQEAVAVIGYPQGGDNISVTKGVVSRVEPTQYVHGASQLLAIQIDAAINPGNSGGPAIMGDKVVGVAFQNLSGAENIGYIIPVPVIRHFIAGVEESGNYVGFCSMGLSCQPVKNVHLRNYFRMGPECTGVLVTKINPLSDAYRVLKIDDIILSFDGVPIANDGTITFRNNERITFDHLVSMKKPNETAEVRVLRNGEELQFCIKLFPLKPLVPVHQFDRLPSYYIFAGLVFTPLTQPYLHEYGDDWYNSSPRRLCEKATCRILK